MNKEILSLGLLTVLFASAAMIGFGSRPVLGNEGYIKIKADGSVVPAGLPVRSFDNVTYVLIEDISINVGPKEKPNCSTRGIVIERSNVIVDGHGHTLDLFSKVILSGTTNVTVCNLIITYVGTGIRLESASNNTICDNVARAIITALRF